MAPVTTLLQVEGSPYHYDSHVQLIRLLRQLGDLDGARKARNAMNEVFPLTEGSASVVRACVLHFVHVHVSLELWLEWLKDELPLASVPEASMELRQLFERATEDYLCECRSVNRLMIPGQKSEMRYITCEKLPVSFRSVETVSQARLFQGRRESGLFPKVHLHCSACAKRAVVSIFGSCFGLAAT